MALGIPPRCRRNHSEMPLPIPYSVISSPNHIQHHGAAVSVIMISTMPAAEVDRTPDRRRPGSGPGLEQAEGRRHQRVQRVILRRPNSPSLLSSFIRVEDDRHQLHDDRGVDIRG